MSRVERVAAHAGQIHALLQRIINECDAAQTEVLDYLSMRDVANKQNEKLKAENEKLREYVAAIAPVAYNGQLSCTNGLYECEFFNQCYNNEPTKHDGRGCKWVIWARELGIEVSE